MCEFGVRGKLRKAALVEAVLPRLCLYGVPADRTGEALAALLGEQARCLSTDTIGRRFVGTFHVTP